MEPYGGLNVAINVKNKNNMRIMPTELTLHMQNTETDDGHMIGYMAMSNK